MRPYGVRTIQAPDVADLREVAAPSRMGRFFRSTSRKAIIRRYWARKARRINRKASQEDT